MTDSHSVHRNNRVKWKYIFHRLGAKEKVIQDWLVSSTALQSDWQERAPVVNCKDFSLRSNELHSAGLGLAVKKRYLMF
jgi:hypothetical protein